MLALLLAGVVYHFTTTFTDSRGAVAQSSGRVYAQDSSYRVDLDPAPGRKRSFDTSISRDNDRTAVLINKTKRTYYDRVRITSKTRSSILFQFPFPGGEAVGQPVVAHRVEGTEMVAGHQATKHVITVEYRLEFEEDSTPINAVVRATETLWCAEDLPRLPFERALTTGWTLVDRELKPLTSSIQGMTIGAELAVTRTFDGGPPISETTRTVVDELRVDDVPALIFAVPADFTYDAAPMAPRRD